MNDGKLFKLGDEVREFKESLVRYEKDLQNIIEKNMEILIGVRFLRSEYRLPNGLRIDSIGIDKNNNPVIIEYKRRINENIIVQSLAYLTSILENRVNFEELVERSLGISEREKIRWQEPKIMCIANEFTSHDIEARIF